jgi:integrase
MTVTVTQRSTSVAPRKKFAFTQKSLDALPTLATRVTYHDTKARGLVLIVFPGGARSFYHYRRLKGGDPERYHIGRFPDINVEDARNIADQRNGRIAKGENPSEEQRKLRAEPTFGELFTDYVERYGKPHKRTWRKDLSLFRCHLSELSDRKISEITTEDLATLHRRIGHKHRHVANRAVELASSMFSWAQTELKWKHENPAKGVKCFREVSRERFLDMEEIGRLLQALDVEQNATARDFILICLLTAGRRSNVESMRWDEVRWGRAVWVVPAFKAKAGETMDIQLSPEVMALLAARRDAPDADPQWVFPGRCRGDHIKNPRRTWLRALRRANIRDCKLHDLRRTNASWQVILGSSLHVVGKALGHSSVQSTAIYGRLSSGPVRDSVTRATSAMLAAAPVGLLPAPRKIEEDAK